MLPALKQIGDYALEKSKKGYIEQIIENPNNNGRYNTVLVILFEEKEDGIVFKEIKVEEFSREKLKKYAYGAGTSRGGDLTPTSKITKLENTFNRIQYPLKNTYEVLNNESSEAREVMGIYQQFGTDEESKEYMFETLESLEEKRKFSLKKENRDKLTLAEDDFFEIMQDFDVPDLYSFRWGVHYMLSK
ncbi:MAG: CRISPR-associated protein Csh1 [Halanaerobiales bacterium]|nr:CRISPR-associated protein Csh1 [Halanaerobiales bacterium]